MHLERKHKIKANNKALTQTVKTKLQYFSKYLFCCLLIFYITISNATVKSTIWHRGGLYSRTFNWTTQGLFLGLLSALRLGNSAPKTALLSRWVWRSDQDEHRSVSGKAVNVKINFSNKQEFIILKYIVFRDYVSGDIESQVITALKELTASKVLRITESGAYLIVHRYIPNIAFGDDLKLSNVTTGLSRKRPASDTSVIFVEENQNVLEEESTVPMGREVKAGRRKGLLKKLNRN